MCTGIVDKYGRITIPAKVRRDLDLHPGDRVRFIETPEGMCIKKESASLVRKGGGSPRLELRPL
jgi:AbrB family looped-hinge helix DNA binding protein